MAQPSSAVPNTTSTATGQIAFFEVIATLGAFAVALGSSVITPVRLAMASTPLNARMTPTKATQFLLKLAWDGSR